MKVVLDTNILISGTFWTGDSFRVLSLIDEKIIELVISNDILEEYYGAIESDEIIEKIMNKKLIASKIFDRVIDDSTIVFPKRKIDVINEDLDDNKILECAVEGKADYIITQDNHLLKLKEFESIEIMKPGDFLEILEKD